MKSIWVLLVLFSLLQFSRTIYAGNNVEDYWRSVTNDQPIPEAIRELLQDLPSSSAEARRDLFVKDFKVKHTLIIYRNHDNSKRARSHVNIHDQEEKRKLEQREGCRHGHLEKEIKP